MGSTDRRHPRRATQPVHDACEVGKNNSATVVAALAKQIVTLPEELRRSLTSNPGKEMARHKSFTVATDLQVYFCDPRSPWQRGSNENTNGLLRQYFPRATNLSHIPQAQLNAVALRLNQRPRKILDFETPADRLQKVLRNDKLNPPSNVGRRGRSCQ